MSGRRRDAERTVLLRRLAEIDERLADHDKRLVGSVQTAAEADERWKVISRRQDGLRRDTTHAEERPHADVAANHHADPTPLDTTGLLGWVAWVVSAYDLSEQWPLCWYRHEGLVAQLLALRRWHTALFTEQSSDLAAPSKWHDALYRLSERAARRITQTCLATHRDPPAIPVRDDARLATATWGLRRSSSVTPVAANPRIRGGVDLIPTGSPH